MRDYIVTCLTYKRQSPKILKMLENDPKLTIWFGVRREEYENGFYDDWKYNPQIQFLLLDNCVDAADTRNKLLDAAYDMGVKYCVQLDDTVTSLSTRLSLRSSPTRAIEDAIDLIERNADKNVIGVEFMRRGGNTIKFHKTLIQAWVIDLRKWKESGVRFRPIAEVGWDDFVFSWELFNRGYCVMAHYMLVRIAKSTYPWANEPGGTHVGEQLTVDSCIAKNNERCTKTKRWLESYFDATNVSIRKLTSGGRTFDYVHADWKEDD